MRQRWRCLKLGWVAAGGKQVRLLQGSRLLHRCCLLGPAAAALPTHAFCLNPMGCLFAWRAAGRITSRAEQQQLILEFVKALPSKAVLWLSFRYNLRQGLSGFYRRECGTELGWCLPAFCL